MESLTYLETTELGRARKRLEAEGGTPRPTNGELREFEFFRECVARWRWTDAGRSSRSRTATREGVHHGLTGAPPPRGQDRGQGRGVDGVAVRAEEFGGLTILGI